MVVWNMIVKTRAPQEWSGIDEFFAADLAVATIALRDARLPSADVEDPVLTGPKGGRTGESVDAYRVVLGKSVVLRLSNRLRLSAQDVDAEDNVSSATARKRKQSAERPGKAG